MAGRRRRGSAHSSRRERQAEPDWVYPRRSASEVKWHFGQVNCIIGRDDQDGFTMFNAIGHALHFGQAINTASGARLGLFIGSFLAPPVHAASRRQATPDPRAPIQ